MSSQLITLAGRASNIDKLDTNRDIILAYLEAGGENIELTDFQKTLLERWERADELIRRNVGKKKREEIANMLRSIYKYHRATAYKDMSDAEHVFASSKPLNKRYLIGIRIEECQRRIREAQISGDSVFEAMMEKTLQKYIEMYPDDIIDPGAKTIIYNIDARKLNTDMPTEDADAIIDNHLSQLPDAK
ncbi:MAG: hypothetical protein JO301_17050 [Chitinophagaceae bacterium]|nr:hypothetical protein [Chitinophagaceae bacterium]